MAAKENSDTSSLLAALGGGARMYDLSDTLSNSTSAVEPNPHTIEYEDHTYTLEVSREKYGLEPSDWPGELAYALENVSVTTHSGTHMDAPYHYAPTSEGKEARKIDEVPLDWCLRPGVLLDMVGIDRERGILREDVERELDRIGHEIAPYDIVLVRTDASLHFGEPKYHLWGPGLRRDATRYLVERGVRIIGIDAWGLDRPFDIMAREAKAGDRDQLWESHKYGSEREYLQLERLSNLASLPRPDGFLVACFPCKIEAASAAWTRVVAIFDERNEKEEDSR